MVNLNGYYEENDKPNEDFEAIPAGEYLAAIVDSRLKSTKSGTGEMLELTWSISTGEFKGRKIFTRLNLKNQNAVAQKIARGEFASIREAVGLHNVADSQQMHNIPCNILVGIEKSEYNGSERINNVIKKYARRGAAPIAEQQNMSAAADGPQPNIPKASDWNP